MVTDLELTRLENIAPMRSSKTRQAYRNACNARRTDAREACCPPCHGPHVVRGLRKCTGSHF
jgi:hypothetical protein